MDQRLVKVEWLDAKLVLDSMNVLSINIEGLSKVDTVGFLVRNDDLIIGVAGEIVDGEGWKNVSFIPKKSVIDIKVLTESGAKIK